MQQKNPMTRVLIVDDKETKLEEQARQLAETNRALEADIAQRKRTEEELHWRTAFFEALVDSAFDGILVVDSQGRKILQNRRVIELWKIPPHIAENEDHASQIKFITDRTKNPKQFVEGVLRLYSHPDEVSQDEIELVDGTILDRYSSPVRDKAGKHYGRIWAFRDITERRRLGESLRLQSAALAAAANAIVITDCNGTIKSVNRAFTALTGYTAQETIGQNLRMLKSGRHDAAFYQKIWQMISSGQIWSGVMTNRRKDGSLYDEEMTITPLRDADGCLSHYIAIKQDITERERLEANLLQSQKMEMVGKLVGSIAHEFNSVMTAIIGESELLLQDLPQGDPSCKSAAGIRQAADRAASLTRQLLAYGRQQYLQPEIMDLNRVLADMDGVLRHLAGSGVNLRVIAAAGLKPVKADVGQIGRVIINMVMNASDAMPNGGELVLETSNVLLLEDSLGAIPGLKPGDYVKLAVTDSGTGMSEEVKKHAFEPFFSTKGVGKGTGLGLATCLGIIEQSGGRISVQSKLGEGTTFQIFLPRVETE
jgi:PAS domain S-box-containing protein